MRDRVRLQRNDLDEDQLAVWDAITTGPRAGKNPGGLVGADGSLLGPFGAMLLVPAVGLALQELGVALRYRGSLSDRAREVAILTVARHWANATEWSIHSRVAAGFGVTEAELAAIEDLRPDELSRPDERAALIAVDQLLEHRDLDPTTYAQIIEDLGAPALFELSTIVGYYSTVAQQMRLFGIESATEPQ